MKVWERVAAPLRAGLATSFLLAASGLTAALVWALLAPQEVVYLGSFVRVWVAAACLGGGLAAGLRGGITIWPWAAGIGVVLGGLMLLTLDWIAPGSLTVGESALGLVIAALLSWVGALFGANRRVHRRGLRNPRGKAHGFSRGMKVRFSCLWYNLMV